jgi:hypothetical protein
MIRQPLDAEHAQLAGLLEVIQRCAYVLDGHGSGQMSPLRATWTS